MSFFATLVEQLAALLRPLFHTSATAAAIVVFTVLVRLAIHPLSRAAARGQRARARLAPQVAALRTKYRNDPERLQRAVLELHGRENVSPLAGCLPSLLQLPAFLLMYHLFAGGGVGGTLLAAPLAGNWLSAIGQGGVFGPAGLVYVALFLIVAAVATFMYVRGKRQFAASGATPEGVPAGVTRVLPLLSFGTLVTVAVVPLAAALYVTVSAAWTAAERALLTA
ncbi:YidC/Oxa1 family membrane protein insertase [Streptomyces sp. MUM 178J]|uniref:YidC/Oxa1 family membrane protein insertase n=1 Tax=Streptomyces sp. MUM 178J TaxID=2791991 RepID=UPI001F03794A|nr:membrane protein insertase YidC [Streptomyces sp. MUM 178J]WRQ79580.1 membrane protein insertase YidC [Streptomyces sp. MUM 178J]